MTAPRVARLAESDWRAFAVLRLRALRDALGVEDQHYRDEAAFTAAQWRRRLRMHAQFAAVLDDRMVGLVGAQRDPTGTVYLYSLWLEPAARRRGLAHDLLTEAVSWARAGNAHAVTLRVDTGNAPALAVYEALGFTVDASARPSRNGEVVMRLDVS